jgi:hypothetical protein
MRRTHQELPNSDSHHQSGAADFLIREEPDDEEDEDEGNDKQDNDDHDDTQDDGYSE